MIKTSTKIENAINEECREGIHEIPDGTIVFTCFTCKNCGCTIDTAPPSFSPAVLTYSTTTYNDVVPGGIMWSTRV